MSLEEKKKKKKKITIRSFY